MYIANSILNDITIHILFPFSLLFFLLIVVPSSIFNYIFFGIYSQNHYL